MITITIEETDKDGRLVGRHIASAPIDKSNTKGIGALLAQSVGGLMYHAEARAEIPLLIAAAGTHRASSCALVIGHAAGLANGAYRLDWAVKPMVDIDNLLGHRASKRDRDATAHTLAMLGATLCPPKGHD